MFICHVVSYTGTLSRADVIIMLHIWIIKAWKSLLTTNSPKLSIKWRQLMIIHDLPDLSPAREGALSRGRRRIRYLRRATFYISDQNGNVLHLPLCQFYKFSLKNIFTWCWPSDRLKLRTISRMQSFIILKLAICFCLLLLCASFRTHMTMTSRFKFDCIYLFFLCIHPNQPPSASEIRNDFSHILFHKFG